MKLLATVQPRHLRDEITPKTARIGRITTIAVTQPVLELVQVDEIANELDGDRPGNPPPRMTHGKADRDPEPDDERETAERVSPILKTVVQLNSLRAGRESISRSAHRLHHAIVTEFLERFAQATNMHVDGSLFYVDVAAPDPVEQLLT